MALLNSRCLSLSCKQPRSRRTSRLVLEPVWRARLPRCHLKIRGNSQSSNWFQPGLREHSYQARVSEDLPMQRTRLSPVPPVLLQQRERPKWCPNECFPICRACWPESEVQDVSKPISLQPLQEVQNPALLFLELEPGQQMTSEGRKHGTGKS